MDNKLRVLQVFGKLNRGGAESMIMNVYNNLDRDKVQFDFIAHTDKECAFDNEIKALGGKIFRAPAYRGLNHLAYVKWWKNFFKTHPEYKIIHTHIRSTAAIFLGIAKKNGLLTIAHSHSTSSGKGLAALVKTYWQSKLKNTSHFLFACSKPAGNWLFGENGSFTVINNAIDTKAFIFNPLLRKKKREELQINNKFVVGHVGRFIPPKNHSFLIDIFKSICDQTEQAVLLLVGDGSLKPAIEKKVRTLGLKDKVIFTGARPDIPDLLQAMDVFLLPSLFEGFGIVLIEAQATGLKCFTSAEVVPNEARITDLLEYIPLSKPASEWAERILKYKNGYDRTSRVDEFLSAGYDIKENAHWLQNFYLEQATPINPKSH